MQHLKTSLSQQQSKPIWKTGGPCCALCCSEFNTESAVCSVWNVATHPPPQVLNSNQEFTNTRNQEYKQCLNKRKSLLFRSMNV